MTDSLRKKCHLKENKCLQTGRFQIHFGCPVGPSERAKLMAVPGMRMGERATQTSDCPVRARGANASSTASRDTAAQRKRGITGCIFVLDAPAAAQTLGAGETVLATLFSREYGRNRRSEKSVSESTASADPEGQAPPVSVSRLYG